KNRLKTVLSYHVVPGTLTAADVKNGPVKTVQGGDVTLYKSGTFLTVEEALVTTPDVRATNGVIQVVDKVLIPPAKGAARVASSRGAAFSAQRRGDLFGAAPGHSRVARLHHDPHER